jgi:hypothetical protein
MFGIVLVAMPIHLQGPQQRHAGAAGHGSLFSLDGSGLLLSMLRKAG